MINKYLKSIRIELFISKSMTNVNSQWSIFFLRQKVIVLKTYRPNGQREEKTRD